MTGEEMERAIEFLLQSHVTQEARQQRTDEQITETSRQLQAYAQTQTEFIEIVTRTMTGLAAAQGRTDERLNSLIDIVQSRNGE